MAKQRGRKTAYKKSFATLAYKFCLLGATDEEIADVLGVSVRTIQSWKKEHPEFLHSIKKGKEIADAEVADRLFKRAMGYSHKATKFATFEGKITDRETYTEHYPPDTTAAIFWLKNRQKDKWRDSTDVNKKGSPDAVINNNNTNNPITYFPPEPKTMEEWLEMAAKIDAHQAAGVKSDGE